MKVPLLSSLVLPLLLLFLSSSSSSSSHAFPPPSTATGTTKPVTTGDDQIYSGDHQQSPSQGDESWDNIRMDNSEEMVVLSEEEEGEEEGLGFMEGRMVIQSDDYPGTGANNRHDPKPPTIH